MSFDLARQVTLKTVGTLPDSPGRFDRGQIEQVLIKLLKNAHEAGCDSGGVELEIICAGGEQRIEARDRGSNAGGVNKGPQSSC